MREAAALAAVAVLAGYVGVVLPRRTEVLLAELRERIARDPTERYAFYRRYLDVACTAVLVFAGTVALGGAGFAAAGLTWPPEATERLIPALVVALLTLNAVLGPTWLIGRRRDPAAFEKAVQYARIEFLVPRSRREQNVWPLFCVAVAVVEEVFYRGLFTLYAAALLGVSPWWLVVPASVAFGNGHRYQGWLGVVATTGVGLALSALTIRTASLWPAIVVHTLVDFRLVFLKPPAPAAPSPG